MNDSQESILELIRSFALRPGPHRVCDFLDALTVFSGDHIAALAQALDDKDEDVRLLAIEVLAEMGGKAEAALPAMVRSLEDSYGLVRIAAVYAVVNFGYKAIVAVPVLETWLDGDGEFFCVVAAAAIIQIEASRADEVLPFLVDALTSEDYGIRCHATWNLGQLGSVARNAVPALRRLLDDESIQDNEALRNLVVDAIESIVAQEL